MERLFTVQGLSDYLDKPVTTIYGWRYRGEGPRAVKVGRELRFRESDVVAWLNDNADPRPGDATNRPPHPRGQRERSAHQPTQALTA